jgi:phenylalanyl-tRNA synthetase beta chain
LQNVANNHTDKVAKLESLFVNNGFSEVVNFPFTPNKEKESINIDNPLDSNRNNLRISLKDSLIENLLYNERRQKDSIKLFEISDIYTKDKVIKQQKKLGLIISGRQGHNYKHFSKKLDQKYLDELLNKKLNDGIFEIIEISRASLNTKKKDKIFYVETPLEDISESFFSKLRTQQKAIDFIDYKPISEFPSSRRDFSFVIEDLQVVNEIIHMLNDISDEIIKDSFLFDYYKDDKRKIIKLGYRLIFQSHLKTLSDLEINKKVNQILSPILEIDGVSIPGM